MKKRLLALLTVSMMITTLNANTFDEAFSNGEVSGQIRIGHIYNKPKLSDQKRDFATAIGGQLKYETAKYHGFDAGVAFYASQDIRAFSGDRESGERNEELASSHGHYSVLAESYIDYTQDTLSVRVGRQLLDTPYADSDDIRMTPNTFEAAYASYGLDDFTFIAAYLTRWQGPDSESDYEFDDLVAGSDGMLMLAATYSSDMLELGAWYYGEDRTAEIFYADAIVHLVVGEEMTLSAGLQFSGQKENHASGIGARLYGGLLELNRGGWTIGMAYDDVRVDSGKEYFNGFGGGAAFVNMDETTAGALSLAQDVVAWKYILSYDLTAIGVEGLCLSYSYGDYNGKEHSGVHEHNMVIAYAPTQSWDAEFVYAHVDDAERDLGVNHSGHPADGTFDRVLARVNYNF